LIRHRIGRIATASSVVALLASMMLVGGVGAANTRGVSFGSPGEFGGGYDSTGNLEFGVLKNTRVTAGGKTAVVARLENKSGSTLNKVKIAGGTIADGKPYNPLFNKPTTTSLPAGATYAAVIPLLGTATCDPNGSASFQCDFGNLAANGAVELLVVINAPSTEGAHPYWFTGSWNEGWSSTGANADYNFAVDNLDVLAASCDNGSASWFLGNQNVELGDGGATCQSQKAEIKSGNALGGNGGFAQVAIDSTDIACPAGFKCFGKPVSVSILGGLSVPGGVEWTVTWFGTKTIKGVIHTADDYATSGNFTPIYLTKAYKCSDSRLTDCWKSVTTSVGNAKPAFVTVVFVTDSNGKGLGF
jgi:hypothetical protein